MLVERNGILKIIFFAAWLLGFLFLQGCSKREGAEKSQRLKFLQYEIIEKVDLKKSFNSLSRAAFEKGGSYFGFFRHSKKEIALLEFDLKTGKLLGERIFPWGQGPGDFMAPKAAFFDDGNYYVFDINSRDRLEVFDDDWNIKKVVPLKGILPIDQIPAADIDIEGGKILIFIVLQKAMESSPTKGVMEINSYDGETGEKLHTFAKLEYETEKIINRKKREWTNYIFLPYQSFALDRKRKRIYVVSNPYSPLIEVYSYKGDKLGEIKLPLERRKLPQLLLEKVKSRYEEVVGGYFLKRFGAKVHFEPYSEYMPFIKTIEVFKSDYLFVYAYDYDFEEKKVLVHLVDLNTLEYKGSLWLPSSHAEYRRVIISHVINPFSENYYIYNLEDEEEMRVKITRLKLKIKGY